MTPNSADKYVIDAKDDDIELRNYRAEQILQAKIQDVIREDDQLRFLFVIADEFRMKKYQRYILMDMESNKELISEYEDEIEMVKARRE